MRNHADWLTAFMDYASYGEAPRHMYFWTGVSAIAGALRRKVWIDQAYFKWYPNFYIVLVAPPGIVSKSTTDFTSEMAQEYEDVCGKIVTLPPQATTTTSARIRNLTIEGAEKLAKELTSLTQQFLKKIRNK